MKIFTKTNRVNMSTLSVKNLKEYIEKVAHK